jgi:nitrous oxidase accessory protein NosD
MNGKSRWIGGSAAVVAAVVVSVAAVAVASGRTAKDTTIEVAAGQSIQQALDRAKPGDTVVVAPGVYHENLTILKSNITLRGAGSGKGGTVLEPAATPHPSICSEFGEVNGICVTGYVDPQTREPGAPIRNVTVSGISVRHFSRYGILLYNGSDYTVSNTESSFNHRYGIAAYSVSGVRYVDNAVHDNTGGGLQIGDAPKADAVLKGNHVYGNAGEGGIGVLLRDTAHGVVRDNRVEGNCIGIALLETDEDSPTRDWVARGNTVRDNSLACAPPEEGGPPLSGVGIALLGASHTEVAGNDVSGNHPTEETPLGGGILVASSASLTGSDPAGDTVRANRVKGNGPADLVYDGSGKGNVFAKNACGTSVPDGLCG